MKVKTDAPGRRLGDSVGTFISRNARDHSGTALKGIHAAGGRRRRRREFFSVDSRPCPAEGEWELIHKSCCHTYHVIAKNCMMQKTIASPFLCHWREKKIKREPCQLDKEKARKNFEETWYKVLTQNTAQSVKARQSW